MSQNLSLYALGLLFTLLTNLTVAQEDNTTIDSLKVVLKTTKDTSRIKPLMLLGISYEKSGDFEKAREHFNKALKVSTDYNHKKGVASALKYIGRSFANQGNFKKGLEYHQKSLDVRKSQNNPADIATAYNEIAIIYAKQGKYAEAQVYFLKNLEIIEEVGNEHDKASSYGNVGSLYYLNRDYDKALEYYEKCLNIFKSIDNKGGMANIYNNIGLILEIQKKYEDAMDYYKLSLDMEIKVDNKYGIADSYNNIGNVFITLVDSMLILSENESTEELLILNYNFSELLDSANFYQVMSYAIQEELQEKFGMALSLKGLGRLYRIQSKYEKSLAKYEMALELAIELGAEDIIFECYRSLAELWKEIAECKMGNSSHDNCTSSKLIVLNAARCYQKAFDFHVKYSAAKDSVFNKENSSQMAEMQTKYETEKKENEIVLLNNKNNINQLKIENDEAEIKKQTILRNFFVLGFILIVLLAFFIYSKFKAKQKSNLILRQQKEEILSQNTEILQQKEELLVQADNLAAINLELDKLSIVARETVNCIVITDAKGNVDWINNSYIKLYEINPNEVNNLIGKNIKDLSNNEDINDIINKCINEKTSMKYTLNITTKKGKSIWVQTTLSPVLDWNGEITKLVAVDTDITKLKHAEHDISAKNKLLQTKSAEITESLNYAKKIQEAVLPIEYQIKSEFPDSFVLYKPKHIVSGDFYWFFQNENKVLFAAADCTGHGVPGAFMSIISINILNQIVTTGVFQPAQILKEMSAMLIRDLKQKKETDSIKDGLDIALCCFDKTTSKLEYAGAHNSMYIIRNDELTEYKADKLHIGIAGKEKDKFTNYEIEIQKEDTIYLFSDGFVDQKGGEKRKKFYYAPFRKLLLDIHRKEMNKQKQELDNIITHWKGDGEQVDDILVLGIRL